MKDCVKGLSHPSSSTLSFRRTHEAFTHPGKIIKKYQKEGFASPLSSTVILVSEMPPVFPERLVFRVPLGSSHTFFEQVAHENGKMDQTTGQKDQIVALPPGRLAEWPRACHFSSMSLKFAHLIHEDSLH